MGSSPSWGSRSRPRYAGFARMATRASAQRLLASGPETERSSIDSAKARRRSIPHPYRLDEPDTSMHPDAAISAVKRVRDALGEHGQLWIATHSLALIAWAGIRRTYFLDHGAIRFGPQAVEAGVMSLFGGDGGDCMRTFLSDAHRIAA